MHDLAATGADVRTSVLRALVVLAVVSCGSPPHDAPSGWEASAPLARAADLDPGETVVEIDLVAGPMRWTIAPGRSLDGYAYNGSVPGPVIEARVGDTLVVHFRNELAEPTTIHWHGIRLPADQDGGPHSQAPVPAGGTHEYRFTLRDEGTFWYHPHITEATQMERGLYGAIVVHPTDDTNEPEVDAEAILMLDDLTLDPSGELAPFGSLVEEHGGREGALQLVNGTPTPTVAVRAGERQRWRIINAGSARFYRLTLPGHTFTVLGTDEGRARGPSTTSELFLVPGDRVDVLVDLAGTLGSSVVVSNEPYNRGHGAGVFFTMPVATLAIVDGPPIEARGPFTWSRSIERIDDTGATAELRFNEMIDASADAVTFTINDRAYPDELVLPSRVGATEVWDLVNESEMDHPFHLHGFFFQVLARDGVTTESATWEDTIHLRGLERVRIAFPVDERPGMWMFHCHILEHVEHGMMGTLEVAP